MKFFESHFWYNKDQRNGILFLIALILILQFIYVFVDFSDKEKFVNQQNIEKYQNQIDSLKLLKIESQLPKIYPFNPNYLTDFKGYQLGMSIDEIDNLLDFRKTGKFINSPEEFQHITHISDSLLSIISPYFKFPEWVMNANKNRSNLNTSVKKIEKDSNFTIKDINTATAKDLQTINGIGEKLSQRIISYRDLLQGFTYDDQIYEVYYLEKEVVEKLLLYFKVIQTPEIEKINLNTASFKEVLHLPYIDYSLTKKIFNYRNSVHRVLNLDELKKIDSFPMDKFDRIALYLLAE